ncbi:chromosome partitioning ATP-binding protein [Candidatus Kinetoplastibacterium desouzaii TCC079E]|uniref:Iron-sulfur cluster carrier protein n=1 Tax=Candidatus Kinetoplastidibacterium desouzai TCC079E TaxID=1208919 RepID=M1LTK0_9PROT|nr:Mrp/NBP35 family ATP-binding protein [Candidatus Kinetoplastibacterium desouzaii]AGF46644.1 chromosome partitioning ATP-binding protein [Candidatus Kinetoplastibacterium desouzaii TCC079E]
MHITIEKIREILYSLCDSRNSLKLLNENTDLFVEIQDSESIKIDIEFNYLIDDEFQLFFKKTVSNILNNYGVFNIIFNIKCKIISHLVTNAKLVNNVKNIIAVVSGKGGVGKSTVSVNIAHALTLLGARVGIVDADIYGPSIPMMLGIKDHPNSLSDNKMVPFVKGNLQSNSLGFLIDYDSPAILRGPMVSKVFEQLIYQTNWSDLDYLIVDMPPGTGDIALTLAKNIPVVGVLIVSTPQDISLMDVRRCIKMYKKTDTNIIGIVENMSFYKCPNCANIDHIFGNNGGKRLSGQYDIPILGEIPFSDVLRKQSDMGEFLIFQDSIEESAKIFLQIARNISMRIANLPKSRKTIFPPIVRE